MTEKVIELTKIFDSRAKQFEDNPPEIKELVQSAMEVVCAQQSLDHATKRLTKNLESFTGLPWPMWHKLNQTS